MKSSNASQLEIDGLFPWGQTKEHLTIQEVARQLGISDDQVRNHLDLGHFLAPSISAGSTERNHVRIVRWSVVAWWREELAKEGQEPPFYQSPQTLWWREKLKEQKSVASG